MHTYWRIGWGLGWPVVGCPRRAGGCGGALLWRWHAGEAGQGWWGLRASLGQGQTRELLELDRDWVEGRLHGELRARASMAGRAAVDDGRRAWSGSL